jgi:hypothetical protein
VQVHVYRGVVHLETPARAVPKYEGLGADMDSVRVAHVQKVALYPCLDAVPDEQRRSMVSDAVDPGVLLDDAGHPQPDAIAVTHGHEAAAAMVPVAHHDSEVLVGAPDPMDMPRDA